MQSSICASVDAQDSALGCQSGSTLNCCRLFLYTPLSQAFDTTQLYGSAVPYLQGTPYEEQAKYLYAVMFARDCRTGRDQGH